MADRSQQAGNRSSVDESRSDGPEDETTVVEPDQGNGVSRPHDNGRREMLTGGWNSTFTYYLAAEARCGFESCCAADFYSRAEEYAGEDYKVGSADLERRF
jgi:hypothetical protein